MTVAHLGIPKFPGAVGNKHDKMDIRLNNLAALCQRCHLNFDRADHIRYRRENARRRALQEERARMQAIGQQELWTDL